VLGILGEIGYNYSMENLANWFLIFIIYSFLGWIVEVCMGVGMRHKISNRGFLIGPICPIYGTGALLLTLVLGGSEKNLLAVFCIGLVGGVTLEYVTSVVMEKMFHVRWWDYSYMPFNLNGRICLQAAVMFGLAAILIEAVGNPMFLHLLEMLPGGLRNTLAIILGLTFVVDFVVSFCLIRGFKNTINTINKDATDEISERVHEIIMQKGKLSRRLVKAFPDFEAKQKETDQIAVDVTEDEAD